MSLHVNPESAAIKQRFALTLEYLKQSDLAKMMIEELEASGRRIEVYISRAGDDRYSPPSTDQGGGTVHWNYTKTLKTAKEVANRPHKVPSHGAAAPLNAPPTHLTRPGIIWGRREAASMEGYMSPALALMHELGHAYQWLTMRDVERVPHAEADSRWGGAPDAAARVVMENLNVNAVENTVAMELRAKGFAEGIRWHYGDHVGKTEDTEETFPGYLSKVSE
jgi:hypothetical protein